MLPFIIAAAIGLASGLAAVGIGIIGAITIDKIRTKLAINKVEKFFIKYIDECTNTISLGALYESDTIEVEDYREENARIELKPKVIKNLNKMKNRLTSFIEGEIKKGTYMVKLNDLYPDEYEIKGDSIDPEIYDNNDGRLIYV